MKSEHARARARPGSLGLLYPLLSCTYIGNTLAARSTRAVQLAPHRIHISARQDIDCATAAPILCNGTVSCRYLTRALARAHARAHAHSKSRARGTGGPRRAEIESEINERELGSDFTIPDFRRSFSSASTGVQSNAAIARVWKTRPRRIKVRLIRTRIFLGSNEYRIFN